MAAKLRITIGGQDFIATVDQQTVTIDGVDGTWTTTARADGRWSVTNGETSATGTAVKSPGGTWVGLDGTVALAQVDSAGARPRARTSDADALRPPMSATRSLVMGEQRPCGPFQGLLLLLLALL